MAWNDILEFDSTSSSQDDNNLPVGEPLKPGKCRSKSRLTNGCHSVRNLKN